VTSLDGYESPSGGRGNAPRVPTHADAQAHAQQLLGQLDAIRIAVAARPPATRDEAATREILAVVPQAGSDLTGDQLDHNKGARLIAQDPDSGVVLLDAASADVLFLRNKIEAFADDSRVRHKQDKEGAPVLDAAGHPIVTRASARAIAPIQTIRAAVLEDLIGPRLRAQLPVDDLPRWFEIACRGGYRNPQALTDTTRAQIYRQLHRLKVLPQTGLGEFSAPEHVYFFMRLTLGQVRELLAATDCIFEIELAPPSIRDMKLVETVTTAEIRGFALEPPPQDAPSVVILDTGISSEHSLLKAALLPAVAAGHEIPGTEDVFGHGTQMAGISLYADLGQSVERGTHAATHWIQNSRVLVRPGVGTAAADNHAMWPALTKSGVERAEAADPQPRNRVFAMAVTRSMQDTADLDPMPTLWSHALDVLAYNHGAGRLFVVSAGNARDTQLLALAEQYPQLQLSEKIHDPAQAENALTVGALTHRVELPPGNTYAEYRVVATDPGGLSPFTSCGMAGPEWLIKPDIVMEGGNFAVSATLPDAGIDTLSGLTTQRTQIAGRPLTTLNMTSEASARGAHLSASVWAVEPSLRPESVRALLVHAASWTDTVVRQFTGTADRVIASGYGLPNSELAAACAQGVATIVLEDTIPNGVIEEVPKKEAPKRPETKTTDSKLRRKVKFFRVPIPDALMTDDDPDVELRVTLSYFAEPNKYGRSVYRGLDLKWDMQGPQESDEHFFERVNNLRRPVGSNGKRGRTSASKSFAWDLGIQLRSRGTVQSDRWRGKMSSLAGDKLIAVIPVLGWWDQRTALKSQEMAFSLVVSVIAPGAYAAIKPKIEAAAAVPAVVLTT
jgi:hypothetical protein